MGPPRPGARRGARRAARRGARLGDRGRPAGRPSVATRSSRCSTTTSSASSRSRPRRGRGRRAPHDGGGARRRDRPSDTRAGSSWRATRSRRRSRWATSTGRRPSSNGWTRRPGSRRRRGSSPSAPGRRRSSRRLAVTRRGDRADDGGRPHDDLPMPFERGRTLLAKGRLHRRRKEKRLADETLREALALLRVARGAGLGGDHERGAGSGRPPPARPRRTLTDTERRVAELAATGLTSREIAERAFLAPKTVGNVLGRVYEKLGIHSRAELGAGDGRVGVEGARDRLIGVDRPLRPGPPRIVGSMDRPRDPDRAPGHLPGRTLLAGHRPRHARGRPASPRGGGAGR